MALKSQLPALLEIDMDTSYFTDTTERRVSSGNCEKSPQWQDILLVPQFISLFGNKYVGGSCVPVLIYQLEDSSLLKNQGNNLQVT